MTVRHLLGRDDLYMIVTDHDPTGPRPPWRYRTVDLHTPRAEARAEWNILDTRGFGVGITIGRNGLESDLGLDLHAGRLASLYLRLSSPWTRWANVRHRRADWFHPRRTGVRIRPYDGCLLQVQVDDRDGHWSRDQPWWRNITLTRSDLLGRIDVIRVELDSGACTIPLPEGTYSGTYVTERLTPRHVRLPGRLLDRWKPESWVATTLDVPGGIPVEGKGENPWDCGMDGLFGVSRPGRVDDAIGALVASVTRDRARYGGPHDLDRPMTVEEASTR